MSETIEVVDCDDENAPLSDKAVVMVVGGLAGLVAKHFAEKGVKIAIKTYRLKKAAA